MCYKILILQQSLLVHVRNISYLLESDELQMNQYLMEAFELCDAP